MGAGYVGGSGGVGVARERGVRARRGERAGLRPMSPDEFDAAVEQMGLDSRDEGRWRDAVRVWFVEQLLKPLAVKMDLMPIKVSV